MNVLNKIKSKKNTQLQDHHQGRSSVNKINITHQQQSNQSIKPESSKYENIKKQLSHDGKDESYKQSKQKVKQTKYSSIREKIQVKQQKQQKEVFSDIFSNRDSDFSDQSFHHIDSLSKVLKIQKQMNFGQPMSKKANEKIEKQRKRNQITTQITYSEVKISNLNKQQVPTQYSELLFVKKGYQIGKMSIFEGMLEHKKLEKGLNVKMRIKQTEMKKFSCKAELIPNPQSISHIYLNKIVEIGDKEYLIGDPDILKVVQKSNSENRRFPAKYN